jgi:hypothetical protein
MNDLSNALDELRELVQRAIKYGDDRLSDEHADRQAIAERLVYAHLAGIQRAVEKIHDAHVPPATSDGGA